MSKKCDIGFVCAYFNPIHYKSKKHNYKLFRKGLEKVGVQLLTVELAVGKDNFELDEFPNVIKVRSNAIIWHKERLLNIGIKKLIKQGYKKVCWLDSDIIFLDDDWPDKLSNKLETVLYSHVFSEANLFGIKATSCMKLNFKLPMEEWPLKRYRNPGFGWAARSEIFKECKLYDKAIIGGGDTFNLVGCYGLTPFPEHINLVGKPLMHFKEWSIKFGNVVKGNVSFIDNIITSLPHGNLVNRQYKPRKEILYKNNRYNPYKDLKLNEYSCYEWAVDKPDLRRDIENYFISRNEDHDFIP